jgi:transcriptional regulator with XRE-family HTH domain
MKLIDYMTSNNINAAKLAEKANVPASTITRLLSGARVPRLSLLEKIMEATNGAVTPNDFLSDDAAAQASASTHGEAA